MLHPRAPAPFVTMYLRGRFRAVTQRWSPAREPRAVTKCTDRSTPQAGVSGAGARTSPAAEQTSNRTHRGMAAVGYGTSTQPLPANPRCGPSRLIVALSIAILTANGSRCSNLTIVCCDRCKGCHPCTTR